MILDHGYGNRKQRRALERTLGRAPTMRERADWEAKQTRKTGKTGAPSHPSPTFAANRRRLLEEGTSKAQRRIIPYRVFDRGTCPGCGGRVVEGDTQLSEPVVRISLPATGVRWWHQSCREDALAALRAEREGDAM